MKKSFFILLVLIIICSAGCSYNKLDIRYKVEFNNPSSHYLEVSLRCSGLTEKHTLFKLPVWTPGYYMILNTPKDLHDFIATDVNGSPLSWRKEGKNGWLVENGNNSTIEISYLIYANDRSVAQSSVDSIKAFISPTTVFLYPDELLDTPVTISIAPWEKWKSISTGLKFLQSTDDTSIYYASDFDNLYDCPIYIGNQAVYQFSHEGKDYELAVQDSTRFDSNDYIDCLKKIITQATLLMGDVPYDRYSFIIMEPGGGGLEHLNSQAVFAGNYNGGAMEFHDENQRNGFLQFMTHEYFHLYNVKTIRPIELGPFDYDKECYTNQLWISEGITVYYEYLLMERAGFISHEEVLNKLRFDRDSYERYQGKDRMSLSRSSYDIWLNFFNWGGNSKETTISYYEKGPVIAYLLDKAIKDYSSNQRSLDDLMRLLYYRYYKALDRGFTEDEFWASCAEVFYGKATSQIPEDSPIKTIQSYIYTTQKVDYQDL